jgi:L-asparaginase
MINRIAMISTGGTVEKTYDELAGVLTNRVSVLDVLLASLELNCVEIVRVPLMNKDSLDMTEADHTLIAKMAGDLAQAHDGVIVVHGTDTLTCTGDRLVELVPAPSVPIILTGAMRPYEVRHTDAVQNMTEALLAVQILDPGIYVVMHNTVLQFPGVRKDRSAGRFVKESD